VFVICSDGVSEAMNRNGEEFTSSRLIDIVQRTHMQPAREIVQAIADAVEDHRAGFRQTTT
jgi:serine phosphatase RsbU (regulator of sigma subunit)